jgi:hypothetical protein
MSTPNRKASSASKGRDASTSVSSQAESWLSAAERKLLDGTLGRSLAEASQKQLAETRARVRALRDKWRDLFSRQMVTTKKSPARSEQANSRSLDKAELFAAAVNRVEARLAELAAGVSKAVRGVSAPRRPTKAARTTGHRASRAAVRGTLAKLITATNPKPRPAAAAKAKPGKSSKPGKSVKRTSAAATGKQAGGDAAATQAAPAAGTRPRPAPTKTVSKKARQAGARKVLATATGAVGFDPKKQRSAKAAATATKIKFDGLTTRRRGSTMMAGKRNQARRDGRR